MTTQKQIEITYYLDSLIPDITDFSNEISKDGFNVKINKHEDDWHHFDGGTHDIVINVSSDLIAAAILYLVHILHKIISTKKIEVENIFLITTNGDKSVELIIPTNSNIEQTKLALEQYKNESDKIHGDKKNMLTKKTYKVNGEIIEEIIPMSDEDFRKMLDGLSS